MRLVAMLLCWGALPKNYEHSVHGFPLRVLQGTYGAKSHFVTIFFPVGAILFLRRVSVQFCDTTDA